MKTIKVICTDESLVYSPNYQENEERTMQKMAKRDGKATYERICGCCGREIKNLETAKALHLIEGGRYFTEDERTINEKEGADMGWWTVGPTCYKKFLKNKKEVEISIKE